MSFEITKETIKEKIDMLSEADLKKLDKFLSSLKNMKKNKSKIRSLKLKGKLDNKHIRNLAY